MNLNEELKSIFEFRPVTWQDYELIYPYTSAYGENSCQHSPVSMASLQEKYEDNICVQNGFLYTLRNKLCDEKYRVYLAPLGEGDVREAFLRIFADADSYGKKVKFITLTKKYSDLLEKYFPGRFEIVEDRNMAEYIYRSELMGSFTGSALSKRRQEVHSFWAQYGNNAEVSRITQKDHAEILEFENRWLSDNSDTHDEHSLQREARSIAMQFRYFDEMNLSGVVLRINGEVHGFSYGTKLNDSCYDTIAEKGDRAIPHIYKVLRQEAVKQCALDYKWINCEEDVGLPGLRALKCAYKPEFLLLKYIAVER